MTDSTDQEWRTVDEVARHVSDLATATAEALDAIRRRLPRVPDDPEVREHLEVIRLISAACGRIAPQADCEMLAVRQARERGEISW